MRLVIRPLHPRGHLGVVEARARARIAGLADALARAEEAHQRQYDEEHNASHDPRPTATDWTIPKGMNLSYLTFSGPRA